MRIPLTQGKEAIVDSCDYGYLTQWKWHYSKDHRSYKGGYARRNDWINSKVQGVSMHRVILERMGHKNFDKSDHIDRNKLNNRRDNLRPTTNQQSNCNRGKMKNNTSGYIGVCWHKGAKKWAALVRVDRKNKHLGYYDDPEEAARIRDEAVRKLHGEFAVLNVIP